MIRVKESQDSFIPKKFKSRKVLLSFARHRKADWSLELGIADQKSVRVLPTAFRSNAIGKSKSG